MWPFALVNTSIPGAVDAVDGVDAVDAVDAVAAVVRGVWPLNNNYSIPYTAVQQYSSTAVQQYNRDSSTAAFHTTHAEQWSADLHRGVLKETDAARRLAPTALAPTLPLRRLGS